MCLKVAAASLPASRSSHPNTQTLTGTGVLRRVLTPGQVGPLRGSHACKICDGRGGENHIDGAVLCSVAQSGPTLCSPMDCNLPGSSVCGILQARVLEWGAMPSSTGSNPGLPHCRRILYQLSNQGGPDSG